MPVLARLVALMASSKASCVGGEGRESIRRDWCRRDSARSGWEDGVSPEEIKIGMRFVVSCRDLVESIRFVPLVWAN